MCHCCQSVTTGPPENSWYSWERLVSLGPCKHICCITWNLEPIHEMDRYDSPMDTFLKHHSLLYVGCTDKKCKDPNATGILFKAIVLARASKVFNPRTAAKLKSTAKSFKISLRSKEIIQTSTREVPDQASNNPSDIFTYMISIYSE